MKNCTKKSPKASNGITLIALVITIIVLLILAGISISMLSGNNGILQKATTAKENTDNAQIQEQINLAYHSALTSGLGKVEESTLKYEIKKQFNKTDSELDEATWLDKTSVSGKWRITISGVSLDVPAGIETSEESSDYPDDWIIAWAYNGSYWSNPYTREDGLLDSYFEDIDNNYSISNVSDLDDANVLALLYENGNNASTYKLVMYGTGNIVGDENGNTQVPWTGYYHRQDWNELSCDYNFQSTFCSNITRLEIQEGITEIGDYCFAGLNISYVYIANSVETIGVMSFQDTTSLTQVEFGNEFNGIFSDSNSDGAYDSFMGSNWLTIYAQAHPESESTEYPQGFVTIPINGVNWKFLWWFD